jgi:lysophospholipase L1-like esterase
MTRAHILTRGALALASVVALASCSDEAAQVVTPAVPSGGAIFSHYVSIGNSIAAGVQSNGINDSTQRLSFTYLLAQSMGTRFAVPFLTKPGCTPPIANWQTGALVTTGLPPGQTSNGATCILRDPAGINEVLNNVAVPSAASTEVDSDTSAYNNLLTTLFLGGKTQVQKAIDADPTFITIEIGPNDVLQAAYTGLLNKTPGISRGITDFNTFKANYDRMIADLKAGSPNLQGGVLMANVRTSSAPILFPAAAFASPAFAAGFSIAATGSPTGLTILPNCFTAPGNQSLVSFAILPQIKGGAHPPVLSCVKGQFPLSAVVGDIFILDAAEQATLDAAVTQMNTYIQAKANEINFAYVDINPILLAQKAPGGCINPVPNLAAAATVSPFGPCVSFDGLHPQLAGQKLIAGAMISAINAKYGTHLIPPA